MASASPAFRPASEISHAFVTGALDLSQRKRRPPSVGWESLPEVALARQLRATGEDAALVRRALTFLAALDRARDADELWRRGLRLYEACRWAYVPEEVVARPLADLADALRATGVSQRHLIDSAACRRIAESILASGPGRPVRRVIEGAPASPASC